MFLGLDLGTTNVKAVIAGRGGAVVARGSAPVETYHTDDGGIEQDIEQIWAATCTAAVQACEAAGDSASTVEAVGVSSQGGAMQLLDADDRPVGRVISWLDARGGDFDRRLTEELGSRWFIEHIGHPSASLTIGQLLRLADIGALPDGFGAGFVGDRIVRRMGGCAAHDATSLSLAMLYNPSTRSADADLLRRLGLAPSRLPQLLPAAQTAGRLTAAAADRMHLPPDLPVSPAVHDQYAAALAAGVTEPGDVMVGTGTAWVLLAAGDQLPAPVGDDAWVCTHVVPDRYGQILALRNGGAAVAWAADQLGLADPSREDIDRLVASAPPGARGLSFYPEAAGDAMGRFDGRTPQHGPPCVVRAVIEGLAVELARQLETLTAAGITPRRLVLTGAAAVSRVTPKIIADATGLDVYCLTEADTSALGAAVLARALAEPQTALATIACDMMPETRLVTAG